MVSDVGVALRKAASAATATLYHDTAEVTAMVHNPGADIHGIESGLRGAVGGHQVAVWMVPTWPIMLLVQGPTPRLVPI